MILIYITLAGTVLVGLSALLTKYVVDREKRDPVFEQKVDRWREKYDKYLNPTDKAKTKFTTVVFVILIIIWIFSGESYSD